MDISTQDVITWVAGGAVTAYVKYVHAHMNHLSSKYASLDKEYRAHLAKLPVEYVSKDDYRQDVQEIKDTLREMRSDLKAAIQGKV